MKYLPLLWAGLFRRKTRTILTLLSIFVAFLLFGLLHAVEVAFESGADSADAKRLLTTARYSIIESLPSSYLRRIEQVPGVVGVAYADWFGAKYQNESNAFAVFAVDPARYLDMYPEFIVSPAHREAFAKTRTGAIAGQRLVDRFGWKVGQKLPIASEIHPKSNGDLSWEFELVGVLDADDPAVRQHGRGADQRRASTRRARPGGARPAGTSSASPTRARPRPSRRRSTCSS
jgi:putative ABC transport system permease protein